MNDSLSARRPLKSRSTAWAAWLSRALLRLGIQPNGVSTFSSVFALGAAGLMCFGPVVLPPWLAWLLAAACIQLRLLCNLMDGMLAVEGGLKTHNGDLFNEFPDRISDMVILAALGHAGGTPLSSTLGWLAACGALMTACIRMHGASLTGTHDFSGPMAKPQRMAFATFICLSMVGISLYKVESVIITFSLAVMNFGIMATIIRRLSALSRALRRRQTAQKP